MTDKKREWSELELDPGHGLLFKNNSDNPKAPEFKGSIEIPATLNGRLDISLWSYTSKAGKPYFKVIVQEPYKKGDDGGDRPARGRTAFRATSAAQTRSAPPEPKDDFDDEDIPF